MKQRKVFQQAIGILVVVLSFGGCTGAPATPVKADVEMTQIADEN